MFEPGEYVEDEERGDWGMVLYWDEEQKQYAVCFETGYAEVTFVYPDRLRPANIFDQMFMPEKRLPDFKYRQDAPRCPKCRTVMQWFGMFDLICHGCRGNKK